jgi:demethylmenaquinone methyltransferase/2-methoxy-6-polyprenyl-1,4-benzoquinol methylase
MDNRYYQPGEQRATQVRALFGAIAPRYNLINDLQSLGLHRCWKRALVRALNPKAGGTVLDVCCGTGDVAWALTRRGARVVGLDFSEPMLREARRHPSACSRTPRPLNLVRGDALRLPLSSETVDAVAISYGLRNLADFEAGLREFYRVVRRGGRLAVLDFGWPRRRWWRAIYLAYLRLAVPCFGWLFCGDAESYAYILESLRHYPAQAGLHPLLERAGWRAPATTDYLGGIMSLTVAVKG